MTITPALRAVMAHGRALGRLCAILSWSLWCVARRSPDSPGWSSWWAAGVCRRLGVQVEIRGPLPERATLVVANHLGYVDILALLSHCPVTFVAKCEIARWPVVGRLAAQAGLIFINRQRLRDVHRVKSAMEEALAAGHTVAYFPEGTSLERTQCAALSNRPLRSGVCGRRSRRDSSHQRVGRRRATRRPGVLARRCGFADSPVPAGCHTAPRSDHSVRPT